MAMQLTPGIALNVIPTLVTMVRNLYNYALVYLSFSFRSLD
jgi:hypothetical protein